MPTTTIEIAGAEYAVEYDYRITCRAYASTGPTYWSGGEPATAMEYEVAVTGLSVDAPGNQPALEVPAWLKEAIEERLQDDDRVYDQICEDA
jgi:hypothetical protein